MFHLCNQVRELYIIKSTFELRALLSCYDLEGIKKEQKEIKGSYFNLMESNDFTYKEYDE